MNSRQHIRPQFVILAMLVLLAASATRLGVLQAFTPKAVASPLPTITVSKPTVSTTVKTVAPQSTAVAANTSTVPDCTPYASSTDPSGIELANRQSGLTQSIDAPTSYQIYGTTASDIERQIAACAPKTGSNDIAEFTAETSYRMTWSYSYSQQSDGTCSLTSIKLGLHVGMVLPQWTPLTSASKALQSQWQTFSADLRTHENGHVSLDQQYAQNLLTQLQQFAPTDCQTIAHSVDSLIQNALTSLNQANDAYDASTNHGATQGAILP